MTASPYICPRCGSALTKVPTNRRPVTQELALLGASDLLVVVATGLLLAIGLAHWVAWLLALAVIIWWGLKLNRRRARYACVSCGIDFPNDMVGMRGERAN